MNEFEQTIAVFGLGIIGSRSATNLADASKNVVVWNRTPKSLPNEISNALNVAEQASTLCFYLKDGVACREVFESIRPALTEHHIIINHSTIDLETTLWLNEQCKAISCSFLDCPFTGSKVAAQNGELVYYVAGDDALLEKVRPILEITSKEIIPTGKVGNATIIKVATNLISASTVQALSEALAIATSNGISPTDFISAVSGNACGSPLAAMKLPSMVDGNYETHFSLDNMLKDARFAIQLAERASLHTPGIRTTANVMESLCEKGSADLDYSALYQQFD